MSKLRATMSISLDGYGAGPDQSLEEPLGVGGEHLHDWMFPLDVFKESRATTRRARRTRAAPSCGAGGRTSAPS